MYGEGISREGSVLDVGIEHHVVQKSGAWFAYGEERRGQGRENAKQYLKDNPEISDRLEAAIRGRPDQDAEEKMTGPEADPED